jgi:uncharacterized protein (TIGR03437 family)
MWIIQWFRVGLPGIFLLCVGWAQAQLSTSAYRVLGQADLRQNGINMVQGSELYAPSGIATDFRDGQVHLYISDTRNSRVLAWQDARSYQMGDAPTLVLGQPGPQYSKPLGIGSQGFASPLGLAVDPGNGNLYVADSGNNRVLRFPAPFSNTSRVQPDAVYGQPGFTNTTAGVSASTMNHPRAVTVDADGNLWVADTGNHRVLRFAASVLNNATPPSADTVIGQAGFLASGANRDTGGTVTASGFDTPAGLAFDAQRNLFVSDFNNSRILKFSAPVGPTASSATATAVIGQSNFSSRGAPTQPSNTSMTGPAGLAIDYNGNLYVAIPGDNRVLVFSLNTLSAGAQNVLGQSDFTTTIANVGVSPQASPNTLSSPSDVKVDSNGTIYAADTGNNRAISIPAGSKTATLVWGQRSFSANGINQVKPGSLNAPSMIAIDYSQSPYALYVSDTTNHRVLGWKDSVRFRNGDPADIVIGQPDLLTALPNVDTRGSQSPSATSLISPQGIAVEPGTGNLFVADYGNNRVLRFPRPIARQGRIAPDAVIGQVDFTSALSSVVTASSLRAPAGLAFGPDGNLFVADSGNNRVLEFLAGAGTRASAIRVYGQPSFNSSMASAQVSAQTLTGPLGIFVDTAFNLYVADTGANRVLIFPNTQAAPQAGATAAFVIGQGRFDATSGGTGTGFSAPGGIATDSSGNIYVDDSGNNRVLLFSSLVFLPVQGATAVAVVGQQSTSGTSINWDSPDGLATARGLSGPGGLCIDRQNTLYLADSGNNRVIHFLKAASSTNAATNQPSVPVALGGQVILSGGGLSDDTSTVAQGAAWPVTMLNRQVVINDMVPAPLYSVGPTQISFQFPSNVPVGSDRVAVRLADTGELIAGGTILAAASSPGLFTTNKLGTGQAVAMNQDNTPNSSSNPAAAGSLITLYGTGQGQVNPNVLDGVPASDPLATTVAVPTADGTACVTSQPSMCVAIGAAFGTVQFSGLTAGNVGLWQITVRIPQTTPPGSTVPVRVVINATPSNTVTVAVR